MSQTLVYNNGKIINNNNSFVTNPSIITYDNAYSGSGAGTSISWPHFVSSGSNSLLVVTVIKRAAGTINSVKYSGSSLTLLTSRTQTGGTTAYMYYYKSPNTLGSSITVALSATDYISALSTNFYNVNQTSPFGDYMTASDIYNSYIRLLTNYVHNSLFINYIGLTTDSSTTAEAVFYGDAPGIEIGRSTYYTATTNRSSRSIMRVTYPFYNTDTQRQEIVVTSPSCVAISVALNPHA